MSQELLTIGATAKLLGISLDTLRRWDKAGRLRSIRTSARGHRHYRRRDIYLFLEDLPTLARQWFAAEKGVTPSESFYCATSNIFRARLDKLQQDLIKLTSLRADSALLVAIAGEIGNNSFDHNLGNWPDISGVFFGYNVSLGQIVLADRGQGVLTTLKRVRPLLTTDQAALRVAFTEKISGRAPESRGNGLKFVRVAVSQNRIGLIFQSGNAELTIPMTGAGLIISEAEKFSRGCLAIITF